MSRKFRSHEIFRKFWDGIRSTLSCLPAQIPGHFGKGNSWQLFAMFCAPKFSGNFGTRNASSRDYTRRQISRKFWNGAFQVFQEILERFFIILRQISRKFRSHEIFRQIWNRSSGAVFEILRTFWGPKFPGNFWGSKHLATVRFVFCSKILREFWHEKCLFARFHEASNF